MLENIAGNTGNLAASAGELGKSGSLRPKAEGVIGQIVLQTGHRLQHHAVPTNVLRNESFRRQMHELVEQSPGGIHTRRSLDNMPGQLSVTHRKGSILLLQVHVALNGMMQSRQDGELTLVTIWGSSVTAHTCWATLSTVWTRPSAENDSSPEDVLCLPNLHDGARWRYNIKTALENVCVYLLDVYSSSLRLVEFLGHFPTPHEQELQAHSVAYNHLALAKVRSSKVGRYSESVGPYMAVPFLNLLNTLGFRFKSGYNGNRFELRHLCIEPGNGCH